MRIILIGTLKKILLIKILKIKKTNKITILFWVTTSLLWSFRQRAVTSRSLSRPYFNNLLSLIGHRVYLQAQKIIFTCLNLPKDRKKRHSRESLWENWGSHKHGLVVDTEKVTY